MCSNPVWGQSRVTQLTVSDTALRPIRRTPRPSFDLRWLQIHNLSLTLRELHSLTVLLERLQLVRIAVIDLRAGRKSINVIRARSDPQDFARPIGSGPAFAAASGLPRV